MRPPLPMGVYAPVPRIRAGDTRTLELWRLRFRWTADARLCGRCHNPLLPVVPGQLRHPECSDPRLDRTPPLTELELVASLGGIPQ